MVADCCVWRVTCTHCHSVSMVATEPDACPVCACPTVFVEDTEAVVIRPTMAEAVMLYGPARAAALRDAGKVQP